MKNIGLRRSTHTKISTITIIIANFGQAQASLREYWSTIVFSCNIFGWPLSFSYAELVHHYFFISNICKRRHFHTQYCSNTVLSCATVVLNKTLTGGRQIGQTLFYINGQAHFFVHNRGLWRCFYKSNCREKPSFLTQYWLTTVFSYPTLLKHGLFKPNIVKPVCSCTILAEDIRLS